ncbi:hypothetical protein ABZS96_25330 [Streptomyces avermitilis]|uniref:hypothetical protein n=1 Tax=Streptomyces avermitilis TaxID=33903 RepID=UPI0033BB2560
MLAARLSEDPGRFVCLVEAGRDYGPQGGAWPRKVLDARSLPRDDVWERHTVHRIRARILGGSSCINGCWNTWGTQADDAERERAGGGRWAAPAMERYRRAAVAQMRLRAARTASSPPGAVVPWPRRANSVTRRSTWALRAPPGTAPR